jgi:GPH family glycoside/pentoside/hexuronide:cation symporter
MLLAFRNRPFVALILAKSCWLLGAGIQSSAIAFFITQALQEELAVLGVIGGSIMVSVIVAQPFWVYVSNRIGKRNAFLAATPINCLAVLTWLLAAPGDPTWAYVLRAVVIGLTGAGMYLTIQSMLPDTMQHERETADSPQEGVLAGIFTTVERGVSAVSVAVTGFALSLAGYVAGSEAQPAAAIYFLYFAVGVVPVLGVITAALSLRAYKLTG